MKDTTRLCKPGRNINGWFVGVEDDVVFYLHSDGIVRESTCFRGKWTGYFATEADALAAIEAWKANNDTPDANAG